MGESSFWCRPTRVVPDQRPLNGRRCLLFSRFLIAKINVALQLTKLCLKIVTTTTATEYLFIRCQ